MTVKLDDQLMLHRIQDMIKRMDKDPETIMQVISYKSLALAGVVPKYRRILYEIPVINKLLDAPSMDQIESQIKAAIKSLKKKNPHYQFIIKHSREELLSNGQMIIESTEQYWANGWMGYLVIYKDSETGEN